MAGNDFDAKAGTWDEMARRVRLAADVAEAIRREVPLSKEWQILDFGCGTGLLALELQPFVAGVTGADSSERMLEVLVRKTADRGLTNVSAIHLRGEEPLPQGAFDLVVSSMTLHHVPDIPALFARLHAALRSGGRIALADLDREDGSFHDSPGAFAHPGFDRDELQSLLAQAGFTVDSVSDAAVVEKAAARYSVFLAVATKPS